MPTKSHYRQGGYQTARAKLLEDSPPCSYCGNPDANVADHVPPVALHDHDPYNCFCELVPSCAACSAKQGGALARLLGSSKQEKELAEPPDTPGPSDQMWQVDWIRPLIESMPESAVWPRFMSAPHPDAVGTHLEEFEEFLTERNSSELLWWQRLCVARILEHDEDGNLVWERWFMSVARQLGKSWLIRELMLWFTINVMRFTKAEHTLLASRKVGSAEQIILPIFRWTDKFDKDEWYPTKAPGRMRLEYDRLGDPRIWLVRSSDMTYGETIGLGVLDECWDIPEAHVTEGLEPTVLASEGFLGFTSTAHRKSTSLALNLRQEAFQTMMEPDDLLILEWSAHPDDDVEDAQTWRKASPEWTKRREKVIRRRLEAAQNGESVDGTEPNPMSAFTSQYLNAWPRLVNRRGRGEPLLQPGEWANTLHTGYQPDFDRVAVLEDHYGAGASVAVAGMSRSEDKIAVTGRSFESHADAIEHLVGLDDISQYLCGASLLNDPRLQQLSSPLSGRGSSEIRSAVSRFRQLVKFKGLAHDGEPDLADQVLEARVREGQAGLSFFPEIRSDFVKAACWAVEEVENRRARIPQVL